MEKSTLSDFFPDLKKPQKIQRIEDKSKNPFRTDGPIDPFLENDKLIIAALLIQCNGRTSEKKEEKKPQHLDS